MDDILYDIKFQEDLADLNRKFLKAFRGDPSGIVWEKFNDDILDWWLNFAIENEEYEVAELFKQEKIKRNL